MAKSPHRMDAVPKKTVAVHDGRCHADETGAVAVLCMTPDLHFNTRLVNGDGFVTVLVDLLYRIKIVRTRDANKLAAADWRVDVGGKYNPATGDYDHHQPDAPIRPNGIPYASFGLVWKQFGEMICGDPRVAQFVDETLISAVDAQDNGFSLYDEEVVEGVKPFTINDSVKSLWSLHQGHGEDKAFEIAVKFMMTVLEGQIALGRQSVEHYDEIQRLLEQAEDSRLLILGDNWEWEYPVSRLSDDVLFVVRPYGNDGTWGVNCVAQVYRGSKFRAYLPERLAGLMGDALEQESGIGGAKFCHRRGFAATTSGMDAAIALAELAIGELPASA